MKTLKLLSLFALAILFSHCGTTSPTAPTTGSTVVLDVARTLDTTDVMFIRFADSTNGNAGEALQRTSEWLQNQANIESVSVIDNSYLYFALTSGLTGVYYLNEVDSIGKSLVRGGNGGGGSLDRWDALSLHAITNKTILLFAPVFDEFYTQVEFQNVIDRISNSGLGITMTIKKDAECSSDIVDHFTDYGFVIMDTHGTPNGFLIGTEVEFSNSEEGFKQEIDIDFGKTGYEKFKAGQIMLARGLTFNGETPQWQKQVTPPSTRTFGVVLTSNYVVGIPKLTGTVIFGNMCYSGQGVPASPPIPGAQTPIRTAFTSLSPISYYGYSYANGNASRVSNSFAKEMEDSLIIQFITNKDSTGHCHLAKDGTEYSDMIGLKDGYSNEKLFLKHYGADDYSYEGCGDSITDEDGQKYKTLCIGKQNWMAENLRFNAPGSKSYNDDPKNSQIYGRLYDWTTLMKGAAATSASPSGVRGICPKGWHIPSTQEWNMLLSHYSSDAKPIAAYMDSLLWKNPYTKGTNKSGFSVLPAGFYNPDASFNTVGFLKLGYESRFWTTDAVEVGSDKTTYSGDMYFSSQQIRVGFSHAPRITLQSCRCVKD